MADSRCPLLVASGLFDRGDGRARHGSTKALVPFDKDRCPSCSAALVVESVAQPALIYHGGYGEVTRTVRRYCTVCPWSLEGERHAENPRRLT